MKVTLTVAHILITQILSSMTLPNTSQVLKATKGASAYLYFNNTSVHIATDTTKILEFYDEDNAEAYVKYWIQNNEKEAFELELLPLQDSVINPHGFKCELFTGKPIYNDAIEDKLAEIKDVLGVLPDDVRFFLTQEYLKDVGDFYYTDENNFKIKLTYMFSLEDSAELGTIINQHQKLQSKLPKQHIPIALDEDNNYILVNAKSEIFVWNPTWNDAELVASSWQKFCQSLTKNKYGKSKFIQAVFNNDVAFIQELIDRDFPCSELPLDDGLTIMQWAIRESKIEIIKLFLDNDYAITKIVDFPSTKEIVEFLEKHDINWITEKSERNNLTIWERKLKHQQSFVNQSSTKSYAQDVAVLKHIFKQADKDYLHLRPSAALDNNTPLNFVKTQHQKNPDNLFFKDLAVFMEKELYDFYMVNHIPELKTQNYFNSVIRANFLEFESFETHNAASLTLIEKGFHPPYEYIQFLKKYNGGIPNKTLLVVQDAINDKQLFEVSHFFGLTDNEMTNITDAINNVYGEGLLPIAYTKNHRFICWNSTTQTFVYNTFIKHTGKSIWKTIYKNTSDPSAQFTQLLRNLNSKDKLTDIELILQYGHETEGLDQEELFKSLVSGGFDVNNPVNSMGSLPLHLAIQYQNNEAVELLLQHGASPFKRNKSQSPWYNAIEFAAYQGNFKIIESLIKSLNAYRLTKDFEKTKATLIAIEKSHFFHYTEEEVLKKINETELILKEETQTAKSFPRLFNVKTGFPPYTNELDEATSNVLDSLEIEPVFIEFMKQYNDQIDYFKVHINLEGASNSLNLSGFSNVKTMLENPLKTADKSPYNHLVAFARGKNSEQFVYMISGSQKGKIYKVLPYMDDIKFTFLSKDGFKIQKDSDLVVLLADSFKKFIEKISIGNNWESLTENQTSMLLKEITLYKDHTALIQANAAVLEKFYNKPEGTVVKLFSEGLEYWDVKAKLEE